jgi:hypothetical protein
MKVVILNLFQGFRVELILNLLLELFSFKEQLMFLALP